MGEVATEVVEGFVDRLAPESLCQSRHLGVDGLGRDRGAGDDGLLQAVGTGEGVAQHLGPGRQSLCPGDGLLLRGLGSDEIGREPSGGEPGGEGDRPTGQHEQQQPGGDS